MNLMEYNDLNALFELLPMCTQVNLFLKFVGVRESGRKSIRTFNKGQSE